MADQQHEGRTPAPTLPPPNTDPPQHPVKVAVERLGWVRATLALLAALVAAGWGASAYVARFATHVDLSGEHASTQATFGEVRTEMQALRKSDIEQAKDLDWVKAALWFQIQQARGGPVVPPPPPPP